jgi:phosphatidylserine/phosphatidylglycerophosphate/cardiolipin synthase-like enzyme
MSQPHLNIPGEPQVDRWRTETATRATVIIDAADYFAAARQAMLKAKHRIMLVGWDFDARIPLNPTTTDDGPAKVGDFIHWLAERTPGLDIYLLRWSMGAVKALARGTTIITLIKWMTHPRIHTKLDSAHPLGASHHQKIVVVDDCFAFCGGIDMTDGRWDTREHLDDNPTRHAPNATPNPPWHDATCALDGPVAAALGELCRARWERAGGGSLEPVASGADCWPDALNADFENVEVAIARTLPEYEGRTAVHEIEALYFTLIHQAQKSLYIESQYFASRRVAEAISKRLDEPDGPEIVIINPVTAEGWLEPIAMDTARARLYKALMQHAGHARFRIYHPHTEGGAQIYVHAKILVADDLIIRVGSSNLNNRSMRLDSECDVMISVLNDDDRARIIKIRNGLIAEHLGLSLEPVSAAIETNGSMIAAIEQLRGVKNRLRPYALPEVTDAAKWLADNEVLDPEGPDEMFEPLSGKGLFRGRLSLRSWVKSIR